MRVTYPMGRVELLAAAGVLLVLCQRLVVADDWHCWRGPRHDGISSETQWTHDWPTDGPPVLWRASLGTGFSSVVVSGQRLYSLGNRDSTDTVYCLDTATGKPLWTHTYPAPLGDTFFEGGPTSTPTVDGDVVYTLSRQGDLFCLEAATGGVRWSQNIAAATGAPVPGWGFAASPVVHGDLLLLGVGEAGTAVDKRTGKLVWTSADREAGYATPLPVFRNGRWRALIASGKYWHAVDIESGREQWRFRWLTRFGCNAASPLVSGDRVFISSGYNRGSALLQLNGTQPELVWKTKEMQNQFSASVLIGQHVYGIDGDTTSPRKLKCLELATGTIVWQAEGVGSGALMAAGDRLIILCEHGELLIVRVTADGFRPLARAAVLDGKCWTAPVLCRGRIYCRSADGELVSLDVRPSP